MMFPFMTEIIISGTMFFLGIYSAIRMQQTAQRTATARPALERQVTSFYKHIWNSLPFVTGFLVGVIVLPHIPVSYVNETFLSFAAGMAFATIVFILQKFFYQK